MSQLLIHLQTKVIMKTKTFFTIIVMAMLSSCGIEDTIGDVLSSAKNKQEENQSFISSIWFRSKEHVFKPGERDYEKTLDVDLQVEVRYDVEIDEAGFLIGVSNYAKENMTLTYSYDHMDIVFATVSSNTFQYRGTLPTVERVYDSGRYIRAFCHFKDGKIAYSPVKYIYDGAKYEETY